MRPILVDMRDMSDSKEVYESRPHPIFVWFIYLILGMLIVGSVWAANFKIDIVVTGTGTITVREDSPTITNTKAGIVTACYVKDGKEVEKGDILYEVSCEELELERANYERQMQENSERLEMLQGYLEWLSDDKVDLSAYRGNSFYSEYTARGKLVELSIELVEQEYTSEKSGYEAKLQAGATSIAYYEGEITKLEILSDAIKNRTNPFSSEEAFYCAKVDEYLTQYQNTTKQYDLTIAGIQADINEAKEKLADAQKTISESKEEAEVTEIQESVVQEAENVLEETNNDENELANALIKEQEAIIKSKQQELANTEAERTAALSNLETSTIASIEASILTNQQYLVTNQGAQEEIKQVLSNINETGISDTIQNVRQTEIQEVVMELSACQEKSKELQNTMESIDKQLEDYIIKAPVSGTVNLSVDLVEGNYLSAGENVMAVIPEESNGYLVRAYIDNRDIAKIESDMPVKYEIAAYPSSEYGVLTGEVEFVSPDLKVKEDLGSAYYMVESSIDELGLYNQQGEQASLKQGMLCETKIIVEQKSVLRYLLEKVNLLD